MEPAHEAPRKPAPDKKSRRMRRITGPWHSSTYRSLTNPVPIVNDSATAVVRAVAVDDWKKSRAAGFLLLYPVLKLYDR